MRVFRNPFYLMAGVYLALDVLALAAMALVAAGVLAPIPGLAWVRIHLLTIGVVVQVILGTLPSLVAARLGTQPPGRAVNTTLWLLVNASFALLLYSMPNGLSKLAAVGAGGVFLAIIILMITLHRRAACPPFGARAGVRFFVAGPLFFLIGIVMAASMLLNWPAPGHFFGQLEAHVHANVWGFLALIVAGFLLERIPTVVGRPLHWPHLVSATSSLMILGALGLVAGPWLAILPLTLAGVLIYMSGIVLLLVNLTATVISGRRWTPNIAHLLVAYVWMIVPAVIAPIVLGLTGKLPTGSVEAAAVSGLISGWVLQIAIIGLSLRLRELRHRTTSWNGSWLGLVSLNLGVLLIWISAFLPSTSLTTPLTVTAYTLIIVGWVPHLIAILWLLFVSPGDKTSEPEPATLSTTV